MKQSLSFLPKTWESRELRRMERMLWERDKDVLGPRHVSKPCFLRDAPFFWSLWWGVGHPRASTSGSRVGKQSVAPRRRDAGLASL